MKRVRAQQAPETESTECSMDCRSIILRPTMGWSFTTLMPKALRCLAGPTPLNISNCGLPSAPADKIISLLKSVVKNAQCLAPIVSSKTTPSALGLEVESASKTLRFMHQETIKKKIKKLKFWRFLLNGNLYYNLFSH